MKKIGRLSTFIMRLSRFLIGVLCKSCRHCRVYSLSMFIGFYVKNPANEPQTVGPFLRYTKCTSLAVGTPQKVIKST